MKDIKIVFTGPPGAGKTTAIAALSDMPPVATDVRNTDVNLSKDNTTVGLDFGLIDLGNGQSVRLFGTPGQLRFEFMWRVIATNALGLVILNDNSRDSLVAAIGGSNAVVISTADGFDLAHAGSRAAEPTRLAAMMSSFAAVGAAASEEAAIGVPRCMVVESTQGRLVVRCMQVGDEPIVIMLLTDKSVLLGLAWNQLSALERTLNQQ